METSFSFFSSFFFWKVTRNTVWNSRPKILKSGRWFSSSPLPLVKLCPSLIYYRGYNGAKWLLFFLFFFFRKRKLGNTRVVHASLVSIIKNDGSLWRVEVFDLNNSVIQGRIYFHLNGGGNTNRSGYSVSKIQKYFMDIDRSEISYLWKSFFDDWNRERKIIVDY